jgi:hypothetical protein
MRFVDYVKVRFDSSRAMRRGLGGPMKTVAVIVQSDRVSPALELASVLDANPLIAQVTVVPPPRIPHVYYQVRNALWFTRLRGWPVRTALVAAWSALVVLPRAAVRDVRRADRPAACRPSRARSTACSGCRGTVRPAWARACPDDL